MLWYNNKVEFGQRAFTNAGVMELADVTDSKSVDGDIVWVRVPPPAPKQYDPNQSLPVGDGSDYLFISTEKGYRIAIAFLYGDTSKCIDMVSHHRRRAILQTVPPRKAKEH